MSKKAAGAGSAYPRFLIAVVLVVWILYAAKAVLVPLALAVLLTFILTPIVSAFQRLGLWRVPSVIFTVVLALGAFVAVGWGVGIQVDSLVHQLPQHKEQIKKKIDVLRGSGEGTLGKFFEMIREVTQEPNKPIAPKKAEPVGTGADEVAPQVVVIRPEESSNIEKLIYTVGPVLEPLAAAGLVLILVVFMLSGREDLRNRLIGLLGHGHLTGTTRVFVDAAERLSGLLLTQLAINVAFGTLFGLGLLIIGVPYAFLWGFLTGLLRFVPYIGTWISVAFPLTLSFALAPDWTQPIIVLVFFASMDMVVGNVIEPLLFGHRTGVTPIALLVAAAFWTWVWGTIGLVLSTPLTVCLVVMGQHVPRLRFFALLLGDKPPLETYVSYYQRLLSRDVHEATQIAADYAKTHGPDNVYDDVLLPALLLAGLDHAQEGLDAEDEEFVVGETDAILMEMEKQPEAAQVSAAEAAPAPETALAAAPRPQSILACPAHQKSEELSLRMLAALLQGDNINVAMESTKTLPADVVDRAAEAKPALVFIAVSPPGGLVQVRYLCSRLRKRCPKLPLVVGYWGRVRDFDGLLVRLREAGATYVTTSLLQSRSRIRALLNIREPEPQSPPKLTQVPRPLSSAPA